jgi:hypothetical protein
MRILAPVAALAVAASAQGATLLGQSVSATLNANSALSISTPFPSPVTTFAGTDFTGGFTDVFAQTWVVTVDFTADTVTIDFSTPGDASGNVESEGGGAAIVDLSGFTDLTAPLHFESFSCTPTGSPVCGAFGTGPFDTITLSNLTSFDVSFGAIRTGDSYTFTFAPEPTTWALLLVGFASLGAALRSRRGKPAAA